MAAPPSPRVEVVADSILSSPEGSEYAGDVVMASADAGPRDVPGPSSLFLPDTEHDAEHVAPGDVASASNPSAADASGADPSADASGSGTAADEATSAPAPAPPRARTPDLPDLRTRPFPPPLDDLDASAADDDEIVARLPVYLSPALFPHVALFQHPLQHRSLRVPSWAQDRGKRISSRVKEGVGRVEIEVPVDADPKVWRDERARDLGFVPESSARENGHSHTHGYGRDTERADKKKKEKEKEEKWGDKMRIRSDAVAAAPGPAYSGIIHEGALHLHPISRTLQFRTALSYLDDFDARNRRDSRRDEEEEKKRAQARKDQPRALDDPNNDGSGSIKDFRNKMWSTQQKEDEDKWVPYEWNEGVDDVRVIESLESLLVPEDRREMLECKARGIDWLDRGRV